MDISPVGFIYVVITIFILVKKRTLINLLLFSIITDIFIEAGYVFRFGKSDYVYFFDYTQKISLLYCFFFYLRNRFGFPNIYVFLNLCYLVPIFLLMIFPADDIMIADGVNGIWDDILHGEISSGPPSITANVKRYTLRFIFVSFISLVIFKNSTIEDYKYLLSKLSSIINIFLVVGFFEYIIKVFLGFGEEWGALMKFLFGYTDSTYIYEMRARGSGVELALFTRESSHYVYSLLLCLIVNFAVNIWKGRRNGINLFTIICITIMLLSTSFSTMLFLLFFILIFFIYRWTIYCPPTMKKEVLLIMVILFLGPSVLMTILISNPDGFIAERFLNLLNNFSEFFNVDAKWNGALGDFSSFARIYSIIMTLVAFLSRPAFGLSLGAAYCHGATAMLLSGIGIIGLFCYIRFFFYFRLIREMFKIKSLSYLWAVLLFFLINLFNSKELMPFCYSSLISVSLSFSVIFSYFHDRVVKLKN